MSTASAPVNLFPVPIKPSMIRGPAIPGGALPLFTMNGAFLFLMCFSVIGSGIAATRFSVGGLMMHPFLLLMAGVFPFLLISRLQLFPQKILIAGILFIAIYTFASFGPRMQIGQPVKLATSLLTVVTVALLVRRRGDFVLGALGLALGIAAMGLRGLSPESAAHGVEAVEMANKNTYSLYALPAMLLAGYVIVKMPYSTYKIRFVKPVLMAAVLGMLLAIFMSGNRSGYVGCVVVAALLFMDRHLKGMILVAVAGLATALIIANLGGSKVFEERMRQTIEGNKSDELRKEIIMAGVQLAVENPMLGVSPQQLPFELRKGVKMYVEFDYIEPHNVFIQVAAGTGLISFAILAYMGWQLWWLKPKTPDLKYANLNCKNAYKLMRMMVILWIIRGMFTSDILFAPGFNIGLGLCVGLCILELTIHKQNLARLVTQQQQPQLQRTLATV